MRKVWEDFSADLRFQSWAALFDETTIPGVLESNQESS